MFVWRLKVNICERVNMGDGKELIKVWELGKDKDTGKDMAI